MSHKQQAKRLAAEIDKVRQQIEQANMLTIKPLLTKAGLLQAEFNRVITEALPND